ncbi:putative uncharacterized protein DDB_G0281733 isoform X2 [Daktulosphaira vitifoliae]|uniref:putative uncharacterized protein DDB_G0281733 isoform X2 n=1 Tax=Daktulosphaira vitifoliae TaxID=58002 RepID=UPI0021AAA5CB|nr:putative uncharacterized protein DDB_G0281733 isoform X2 [Daktulosphaira vitifoliae]
MSRYSLSSPSSSSSSSSSDDSSDESSTSTGSSSSSSCSSALSSAGSSSSSYSSSSSSSDDSSDESSTSTGSYRQSFNLKRKFDEDLDKPNKKMCCEFPYGVDNDWSFKDYQWLLDPEREPNVTMSINNSIIEHKITVTRETDVGIKTEKDILAGVELNFSNSVDYQNFHSNSFIVENPSDPQKPKVVNIFSNPISLSGDHVVTHEGYENPKVIVENTSVRDIDVSTAMEYVSTDFATNVGPIISNSIDCQHVNSNNGE